MYCEAGIQMVAVINASLGRYINGYHEMNLLAKKTMGLQFNEIQKHMTKEVYSEIAKIRFQTRKQEYVFSHFLFLDC